MRQNFRFRSWFWERYASAPTVSTFFVDSVSQRHSPRVRAARFGDAIESAQRIAVLGTLFPSQLQAFQLSELVRMFAEHLAG